MLVGRRVRVTIVLVLGVIVHDGYQERNVRRVNLKVLCKIVVGSFEVNPLSLIEQWLP